MDSVKGIKTELEGSERRLAESLGHSREIGRLLGMVELGLGDREEDLRNTGEQLSLTSVSLERTQRDLVEQMEEGRKRRDEIEGLGVQLREEKAECNALQARLKSANSSVAQLQRELGETRTTSKSRKDEVEMLSLQLLREKGQVSSLKYEVDSRKKTASELEARIVQLEKRHRDSVIQGDGVKRDLEKRRVEKAVENESLKKTVDTLERKARNSDAAQILKSKEVLEGVYKSLQRQFQTKEDELTKAEREREEYRLRLLLYTDDFEPTTLDKTFGLRGKGKKLD